MRYCCPCPCLYTRAARSYVYRTLSACLTPALSSYVSRRCVLRTFVFFSVNRHLRPSTPPRIVADSSSQRGCVSDSCVFCTLNHSVGPSTSSAPSVRADFLHPREIPALSVVVKCETEKIHRMPGVLGTMHAKRTGYDACQPYWA